MVSQQTIIKLKDNSKILKVKLIRSYLKKNIKCKDMFLGVVLKTRDSSIKKGTIHNLFLCSTKMNIKSLSGRYKNSNKNQAIKIKDCDTMIPTSTRFVGNFLSDLNYNSSIKFKNMIEKCI